MNPSAVDDAAPLRAFVEKAAVCEVLENYFHGLDAREEDRLAACFTDDAAATHHSGSDTEFTLAGGAAIARYFCELFRSFTATNHTLSNSVIQVTGDAATADTFAIAHVISNDRVRVRGIRYLDELVRVSQHWRICKRTHIPRWQYEADPVKPSLSR
jgi:ketosteroid isomerase-like protein